ncbi:alpha/beta hydrolase family protein [Flindersiella endophytica]
MTDEGFRTVETADRDGVRLSSIEFGGTEGYLLLPPGSGGRAPGVVYAGQGGVKDRFLDEALELARDGAVVITALTEFGVVGDPATDLAMVERAAEIQRHALAVLRNHPQVDATRIGFVGHGWGATQAACVAGGGASLRTLVLAGTGAHLSEFLWSFGPRTADRAAYVKELSAIDPIVQLDRPLAYPVLFQVGSHDQNVPPSDADELWQSIDASKDRKDYDCDHNLVDHPPARADRRAWLREALGIDGLFERTQRHAVDP